MRVSYVVHACGRLHNNCLTYFRFQILIKNYVEHAPGGNYSAKTKCIHNIILKCQRHALPFVHVIDRTQKQKNMV